MTNIETKTENQVENNQTEQESPLSEAEGAIIDRITEQLKNGEIPEVIREELKLVDENSQEGKRFQRIMSNLINELYSETKGRGNISLNEQDRQLLDLINHDFRSNPIRFFLSDENIPNACYIVNSNPPCIVLNKGLFEVQNSSTENPVVKNIADLAMITCHEVTHYLLNKKYGQDHKNSKGEETLADTTIPLLQLYLNGFNPSEAISALERINAPQEGEKIDILTFYLDEHPNINAIKEIASTYIASLVQSYGSLEATRPEDELTRKMEENYITKNEITSTNEEDKKNPVLEFFTQPEAKHISALDKFLDRYLTEDSTTIDKIDAIKDFLTSLDNEELYPVRIKSCTNYLKQLEIDRESEIIKEKVSELADAILDIMENTDRREIETLYRECCYSLSENRELCYLGRLDKLRKAYEEFVETVQKQEEDFDFYEISTAAKNLVEQFIINSEAFQKHRIFFKNFEWKEFPNLEGKIRLKKYIVKNIDWIIDRNPEIIEAGFLTGLSKNTNVMTALAMHHELFFKYYKDNFSTIFSTMPIKKIIEFREIINSTLLEIISEKLEDPTKNKDDIKLIFERIKDEEIASPRRKEFFEMMKKMPELYFDAFRAFYNNIVNIRTLQNDLREMKETDKESYIRIIRALYDLDKKITDAKPLSILFGYNMNFEKKSVYYDILDECKDDGIISERDKKTILSKILIYNLYSAPGVYNKKLSRYFFKGASSLLEIPSEELEHYDYKKINKLINSISSDSFCEDEKNFLRYFSYMLFLQRYSTDEKVPYDVLVNFSKEIIDKIDFDRTNAITNFLVNTRKYLNRYFLRINNSKKIEDLCSDFISLDKADLISENLKEKVKEKIISKLESLFDTKEYDRIMQICKTLLISNSFDLIRDKNQIIDLFVEAFKNKYDIDNGSLDYCEKIKEYVNTELQNEKLSSRDRYQLYERIASNIEAQKDLSFYFEKQLTFLTEENLKASNEYGWLVEYISSVIKKDRQSDRRIATVDFLQSKGEENDVLEFLSNFDFELDEKLSAFPPIIAQYWRQKLIQELSLLNKNFHAFSLPEKAVVVKYFLSNDQSKITNETFDIMLDKIFSPDIPYAQAAKDLLRTHISYFQDDYRDLVFSSLLTTNNYKDGSYHSAGELITIFAENMGPAYMKVMQAIEGNTAIPKDLRDDISRHARRLKFDGARPTRWELWHCLENIDPNALDQFSHIGDIIGNASMNIAVEVTLQNGEDRVLSLLRPNAQRKAKDGFKKMSQTAKDEIYKDTDYRVTIEDLVESASNRVDLEADCEIAPKQYAKAFEMYHGKIISLNGRRFVFEAARVQEAGENYYIMEKIDGQHFTELPEDSEEQIQFKRDCAKAILTLELSHIFNGQFDSDRHGGQMKIVQNGSDVYIGHFDFKGMRIEKWQDNDYQQLAKILCTTVLQNLGTQNGGSTENTSQSFSTQSFIEAENEILKQGEQISPLISEVRKALLSLNEYFNLLDDKEIAEVAFSALLSGRLSPDLVNSITDNIVNGIYSSSLTDKYPILKLTPKGIIKTLVKNTLQGGNLPNELKGMLQLPDDFELIKIK